MHQTPDTALTSLLQPDANERAIKVERGGEPVEFVFGTPPLRAKEEPVESRRRTEFGSEVRRLAQNESEPQGAFLFPEQTDLITHRQEVFEHGGVGQASGSTTGGRFRARSRSTRMVPLGAQYLSEVLWVGMSHVHLP
jgi:hypothetical protein